jgi:hypothetical protein
MWPILTLTGDGLFDSFLERALDYYFKSLVEFVVPDENKWPKT